jgi:sugar/nucleoside kinase (ribokinase family)
MDDSNNLEILCIGNALIDIFVQTDTAFLKRFGLNEPVSHVKYEKITEILKNFPNYTVCSGGGAANVAKIAALLGVRTGFIGTVGPDDSCAKVFKKSLSDAGTRLFLTKTNEPTGVCVFLQRTDECNYTVASPSAAYRLGPDDVSEEAVQKAQIIVIDGFIIGRSELVQRIFDLSKKYGTVVALDVGSVEMAETYAKEIVSYCNEFPLILFMNQDEAEAFYRGLNHNLEDEDEEETASFMEKLLNRRNPLPQKVHTFLQKLVGDLFPVIVVKLGAKGAVVFAGGKAHREDTLAIIPKETSGAGDAFCAAFLGAWLHSRSFSECATFGNKAAREVLDVNGTLVDRKKFAGLARILCSS